MTDELQSRSVQCIRCDKKMPECLDLTEREYVSLPYNQETGALPICNECFEEVKGRDLWNW